MLNLPKPPTMLSPINARFVRSKKYTKLEKLAVYDLLFDSQLTPHEMEIAHREIAQLKTKNDIFNLLFSQKKVF